MANIIALCNQKGGTGKTTTAINISVALSLAGKKILLVDLDPQANSTSGIGVDKSKITQGVYNALIEDVPVKDLLLPVLSCKMSILPASSDLAGAEIELVSFIGREYRLKKSLESSKTVFDFIIIDCPPSLGLLTINALTAANSVMIPVQCEYYALEGLTQLMGTVELVRNNLNSSLEVEGVLLTMADYRTKLTQEVIAEVRNYFKEKAYRTVIPRNVRLSEAPSFGQPIFAYDKDSIGAKKYWELACEMLGEELLQPFVNNDVATSSAQKNSAPADSNDVSVEQLEKESVA